MAGSGKYTRLAIAFDVSMVALEICGVMAETQTMMFPRVVAEEALTPFLVQA